MTLRDRLKVGRRSLKAKILVRFQVPQPFLPSVVRAFGHDKLSEGRSRTHVRDKKIRACGPKWITLDLKFRTDVIIDKSIYYSNNSN